MFDEKVVDLLIELLGLLIVRYDQFRVYLIQSAFVPVDEGAQIVHRQGAHVAFDEVVGYAPIAVLSANHKKLLSQ